MGDAEEPQFQTLKQRIAALKQQQAADQIGQSPDSQAQNGTVALVVGKRPPPPPVPKPSRPVNDFRSNAVPTVSTVNKNIGNELAAPKDVLPPPALDRELKERNPRLSERNLKKPPPLPSRKSSQQSLTLPALPSRRPSEQLVVRKASNESFRSNHSTQSGFSYGGSKSSASSIDTNATRKLPPRLDEAALPALPPSRREQAEAKARLSQGNLTHTQSSPAIPRITRQGENEYSRPALPSRPSQAPALPSRSRSNVRGFSDEADAPPPMPRRPATSSGREGAPPMPNRPSANTNSAPPPIPASSKPSMRQIDAIKAKQAANSQDEVCLICRDFSAPDEVAAKYPRQSLPRGNSIDYLADALCGPFTSHTDKARAIFMWCHLNINYDVDAFLGNRVKGQTPDETIRTGMGVCEGYAKVFAAIAVRGGLECLVVGGHGKGYGYVATGPGQRLPPANPTGHAWNAVRIDGGEWKLCDPCWGSGALGGDKKYHRAFTASEFTGSNEDFGLKHFPSNKEHFFRADRRVLSWEEYILGPHRGAETLTIYNTETHGIDRATILPALKQIELNDGDSTRFQFARLCQHWDFERHGGTKPYLLAINIGGTHAYAENLVPLERDEMYWWVDIPHKQLGSPGETIKLYAIETLSGQDARGLTKKEFMARRKTSGMSFAGVAEWELV
ncbi:hypothetical protein V493_08681 [Pseudogymnoascus sp. VKM F-4281 (FW-2241)]|nr:hypothetical protein V493_08681 [Pseudogymnoascus sp. VKM F-4281 (FW-2241)]